MAIFGFFKGADDKAKSGSGAGGEQGKADSGNEAVLTFDPKKAIAWFNQARTVAETGNYEYAMSCWLSGLRFDPQNMEALQGFFTAAAEYRAEQGGGLKGPPKDVVKSVAGKTPLDRYLNAILNWACRPMEIDLALKAVLIPAELGLREPALWIGPKAFDLLQQAGKPRKDHMLKLMEAFTKFENYDMALRCGEVALRIDPTDIGLGVTVKNLAANSTMSKGGYDNTGEEGGFRKNMRDIANQQRLEEGDRLSKSEDVATRVIATAKAEYLAKPADRPNIKRYVEALLQRGALADENEAAAVLAKAYADTQEYRFKQTSGDIKIKQGRRAMRGLREAVEAKPGEEAAAKALADAIRVQLELEISEFASRIVAYPTDLLLKYELGTRYLEAKRYNEAIDQLQQAKSEGKNKLKALHALGTAFAAIDWLDESVDTFRQALEGIADNDQSGIELRYSLLCALQRKAEADREITTAEEASALASKIAQLQFGYKDVRQRRETLKALIAQLKAG